MTKFAKESFPDNFFKALVVLADVYNYLQGILTHSRDGYCKDMAYKEVSFLKTSLVLGAISFISLSSFFVGKWEVSSSNVSLRPISDCNGNIT